MENEFDDDTILEPRQRKPLGSIYQFIFLTTNPKLKDYPSRQKSLLKSSEKTPIFRLEMKASSKLIWEGVKITNGL